MDAIAQWRSSNLPIVSGSSRRCLRSSSSSRSSGSSGRSSSWLQVLRSRSSDFSYHQVSAKAALRSSSSEESALEMKWIETIRKDLLSMSSAPEGFPLEPLDMAWIARIPSCSSGDEPMFPQSIQWIIRRQNDDGSWGELQRMSSTLACLFALALWKKGSSDTLIRGQNFVNCSSQQAEEHSEAEVILFSGLLHEADEDGLQLNVNCLRELPVQGSIPAATLQEYPASFIPRLVAAHKLLNWRKLLVDVQCSNGSILDSIPLTVCAFMHTNNGRCLQYLKNRMNSSNGPAARSVPSLAKQLHAIDWLERVGVERHFRREIQDILSRALRMCTLYSQDMKDTDVFRRVLQRHGYLVRPASDVALEQAVKVMKFSMLPRLEHKNCISSCDFNASNGEAATLAFAKADFNACQLNFQDDLKRISKWYEDYQLGALSYSKNKAVVCYFSTAATMFPPDLSVARLIWTQMSVLTTVIDDYFDMHDSLEDLQTFCAAVRSWNTSVVADTSTEMLLLLRALFGTVNSVAEKAFLVQGRDMSKHLRSGWDRLTRAYLKEAEWRLLRFCPIMEEYLQNGLVSFALEPIIMTTLLFVGVQVEDSLMDHADTRNLLRLVSLVGRLLNDLQGYKRESAAGELSWIALRMQCSPGMSVDECSLEIRNMVDEATKILVDDLVHPSSVPKRCKQVFESMARILHFFYRDSDGFRSDDLREHMKNLLYNPL